MLLFFFARTTKWTIYYFTPLDLTFSQLKKRYPSGKEESADAVTVTDGYTIFSEVGKPVDCLNCALTVVIANSSPYLFIRKC